MSSTHKIYFKDIPIINVPIGRPNILVEEGNMIEISEKYERSCIHNFANNDRPGGPSSTFNNAGYLINHHEKSNTQEDQIIRYYNPLFNKSYKSTLILPHSLYPIIDESIQNSEALLYSICPPHKPVITLPSVIGFNPNKQKIYKKHESMVKRILLLLYVSTINNHVLITGLWGCGAFGINPSHIVSFWKEALTTSKYFPPLIIFVIKKDEYTLKYDNLTEMFKELQLINK